MPYLLFVTLLWAVSFNLIGVYLAGAVDSYFAVLTRVLLAGLIFLPMTRWRGVAPGFIAGVTVVGMLQFGVTYLCLYLSFNVLTVAEVLLFTVLTPLHVALIDDALNRRFNPWALLAAVAVFGAGLIRYDDLSSDFLGGFLLLQLANFTFAAGQVGYKHLAARYQSQIPLHRRFGYFFIGALLVVLPAWLVLGDPERLPTTSTQWSVLLWMGVLATALGQFCWNKGATLVNAGTLNNLSVPVGLIINFLVWGSETRFDLLLIGGSLILVSLWISRNGQARYASAS
jgi:carboxylate/amino acid/amine transporter